MGQRDDETDENEEMNYDQQDNDADKVPYQLRVKSIPKFRWGKQFMKLKVKKKYEYHSFGYNCSVTPQYFSQKKSNNEDDSDQQQYEGVKDLKMDNSLTAQINYDNLFKAEMQFENLKQNNLKMEYKIKDIYQHDFFKIKSFTFPVQYKNNFSEWQFSPIIHLTQNNFLLKIQSVSQIKLQEHNEGTGFINAEISFVKKFNENYFLSSCLKKKEDKIDFNTSSFFKLDDQNIFNFEKNFTENNGKFCLKDLTLKYQKQRDLAVHLQYKQKDKGTTIGLTNKINNFFEFGGNFNINNSNNSSQKSQIRPQQQQSVFSQPQQQQNSFNNNINININNNYKNGGGGGSHSFLFYFKLNKFQFGNVTFWLNDKARLQTDINFKTKKGIQFNVLLTSFLMGRQKQAYQYPLQFNVALEI